MPRIVTLLILTGCNPAAMAAFNACEHVGQFVASRQQREALGFERIEADGDALQACVFERPGHGL